MSIPEKDVKILWAKAAGRCSMPDCRKIVIASTSTSVPSQNTLIGENCHIIGEKNTEKSPRGISNLPLPDRNRYPNLILLCRNHHKIIDTDEKEWTTEKLHQIKSDHELWVETSLSDYEDEDDKWYSDLINLITEKYILNQWEYICDHAFRNILAQDFADGISDVSQYIFKALFPKTKLKLDKSIMNLDFHASKYINHYLGNSYLDDNNFYRARKFYKEINPNPNYHTDMEKYNEWEKISTQLLFNFTHALNEFSDQVRESINKNYLKYQGKFIVLDSMGLMGGSLQYTTYIPNEYQKINEDFKL